MPPSHGTPRSLTKLATGGNSEIFTWEQDRVLKLFRPGFTAQVVATEMHHARLARALGIPTPQAYGLVEIDGRRGIIYERCVGPTIFELIITRAAPVERLAQVFFEFQRAIHRCQEATLPPLRERVASKILRARGVADAVKQEATIRLRKLPDAQSVCHGDFHPVNVIMSAKGPIVIDWLDAGRGDPTLDVARTLLLLEHARPKQVDAAMRKPFLAAYEQRCRETWPGRLELLERWRLPVAVARLAEVADEAEQSVLLNHVNHISAAAP